MDFMRKYKSLSEPHALSGLTNVFRYNRGKQKDLKHELFKISAYNYHREAKKPRTFNPIYVYSRRDIMQCDLAEIRDYVRENNGVRYLLIVCDSFSRKAWIRPLVTKEAVNVHRAFVDILNETGNFRVLYCDRGTEFTNELFKGELQNRGIQLRHPNFKCGTIERLNRTIELLIYRYITAYKTFKYVDKLSALTNLYNSRYQRVIKCTPNFADMPENRNFVINSLSFLYDAVARKRKKPKFKVGDEVLIQKQKRVFAKGYDRVFVRQRRVIKEVHTKQPIPMYSLMAVDGRDHLSGRFYENELQPITTDVYEIEGPPLAVRRQGGRLFHFVKFAGYPERFNDWIEVDNITDDI